MTDGLNVPYEEYTLKGARTSMHVSFPTAAGGDIAAQIPTRRPNIVPRRVYLMPGDFSKHGFSQGCPGCIYAQDGIGPKRDHSEARRRRMEEDIGKDESDTRADSVQERQDHFIAQQVEQNEREGDLRREDVKEPENVDVGMEIAVDEDELTDAPKTKTDIRLKSPERKKAAKRSTASHDEEPSTTRITCEDAAMEEVLTSTRWPLERKISLYLTTPS